SNIGQLTVPSTSAVRNYNSQEQDPLSAGRRLGVESVLDANFQRDGERIRVTVRLWRGSDGATRWGERFDQKFCVDVFGVQDVIAERVAASLPLKLTRQEQQMLIKHSTWNIEAYQLYNIGMYHFSKWNEEGWLKSRVYFEQAIAKDPNYALAYAGLSGAWGTPAMNGALPLKEGVLKSEAAALKALALDEMIYQAHAALGGLCRNTCSLFLHIYTFQ